MNKFSLILFSIWSISGFSQEEGALPYREIPDYSDNYTAGTVAARMIDALGFRFYWASNTLSEKDLAYKATDEGRTSLETIEHIYSLSKTIVNATQKQSNSRDKEDLSYSELRSKTLQNLKIAADILRESDDISQYKIIFGDKEIPFWNQVNGPIADPIWHCGQLVIYRRVTGNPRNPKVNHFSGKVSD